MSIYVMGNSVCFNPGGVSYYDNLVHDYGGRAILKAWHAHTAWQFETLCSTINISSEDYFVINYGIVEAFTRTPEIFLTMCTTRMVDPNWALEDYSPRLVEKMKKAELSEKEGSALSYFSILDLDEFSSRMDAGLRRLLVRANPNRCIVLGLNNPADDKVHRIISAAEYDKVLLDLSVKYSTHFIDCYNIFGSTYLYDGIHFNEEGHKKITYLLEGVIQ